MSDFANCLRCGEPRDERHHEAKTSLPEGWHPFRGTDYLDAIEDALLFVREKNQPHEWRATGVTVDTALSFSEKRCGVCGGINWGGKEGGVCFGNHDAELALTAAHNRRAFRRMSERGEEFK